MANPQASSIYIRYSVQLQHFEDSVGVLSCFDLPPESDRDYRICSMWSFCMCKDTGDLGLVFHLKDFDKCSRLHRLTVEILGPVLILPYASCAEQNV